MKRTQGSETSQYLEEEKSKEIPLVAASEGGRAQTDPNTKQTGIRDQELVTAVGFTSSQSLVPGSCLFCVRVGVVGPRK